MSIRVVVLAVIFAAGQSPVHAAAARYTPTSRRLFQMPRNFVWSRPVAAGRLTAPSIRVVGLENYAYMFAPGSIQSPSIETASAIPSLVRAVDRLANSNSDGAKGDAIRTLFAETHDGDRSGGPVAPGGGKTWGYLPLMDFMNANAAEFKKVPALRYTLVRDGKLPILIIVYRRGARLIDVKSSVEWFVRDIWKLQGAAGAPNQVRYVAEGDPLP